MDAPAAVLWDMDGTLVDTEPLWIRAEFALAESMGAQWTEEHSEHLIGQALLTSGEYIREHMGIDLTPHQIVDRLLSHVVDGMGDDVPWRPGALELLAELRADGVPCGLVTMSWQPLVAPVLRALPEGSFATVVTGDIVSQGKPHPEPYLTAARNLGLAPEDCLAIEDSHTGASSAEAAGCAVLVVPHHVAVPSGDRRIFRDTLAGLTSAGLSGAVR